MSKLDELKTQFEAAKTRMEEEGKAALREAMTELFDAHPKLKAVRWRQYTPYFNDGDSCEFSVNSPEVKHVDLPKDGGDDDDGFHDAWYAGSEHATDISPDAKVSAKAVSEMFRAIPDPLMLAAFGDHVAVTANRRGFDVEEYSHD